MNSSSVYCPYCFKRKPKEGLGNLIETCSCSPDKGEESFTLTRDKIRDIVNLAIEEARDAWHWGEGMDLPVLWLRIDRDILGIRKSE